ncbi:MAG: hypothetical protein CMK92_01200 [Pseudomonas sp.]|nr:hypothetical protein [Pseudomonas sp.]
MAVVKGSTQDELVIQRRVRGYRIWRLLWLASLILITAVGGFLFGHFDSRAQIKTLKEERRYLSDGLRLSEQTIDDLSQRVVVLEKGGEVDRQAAEDMRTTILALQDDTARLTQEVAFYKGIMAPGNGDKGLRVSKMDLVYEGNLRYRYSIMLTQVVDNTQYVSGDVAVNIIGRRNGEKEIIALRDVDESITELGIDFRFRYFQELKGTLTLPEGFSAQQLQVVMQSSGRNSQRVEASRPWNSEGGA